MDASMRREVLAVLARFGITEARRAVTTDATEEVVLLAEQDRARVDVDAVTRAVMAVVPHTKVWIVEDNSRWRSEPL